MAFLVNVCGNDQWYQSGVAITGAIYANHKMAAAEYGTDISVIASFTDGHGTVENIASDVGRLISGTVGSDTI